MSNGTPTPGQDVAAGPQQTHRVVLDPAAGVTLPVVLVPGVMGSRLLLNDPNGGHVSWDPDTPTKMGDWITMAIPRERAALKSWTGTVMRVPADEEVVTGAQRLRGWGGVAWGFYGGILQALEAQNNAREYAPSVCPVYACGYDWRKSNNRSADRLASVVNDILEEQQCAKVILLTHSMGGIVSRAACAMVDGFESKVAGIIHCVQPAAGAAVAYRRFHDGAVDVDGGLSWILGDQWWKYTAIVSGAHGPIQLMPTSHYTGPVGAAEQPTSWLSVMHERRAQPLPNPDVWANYLRTEPPGVIKPWTGEIADFSRAEWEEVLNDLRASISGAHSFHQRVGLHRHPNTFVVVSSSHPTQTTVVNHWSEPRTEVTRRHPWTVSAASGPGDATVPESSARAIRASEDGQNVADPIRAQPPRLLVTEGEHGKVFDQSPAIRTFIVNAIRFLVRKVASA